MVNLKTELCGITLKNPVIAASGCFGFGQEFSQYVNLSELGGIALKALTVEKRLGNPSPRIAETPSGILNAVGLQNPGVDYFLAEEMPKLKDLDTVLFANVAGSTIDEYCQALDKLNDAPVDFIELNISCPNVSEGGASFGMYPQAVTEIVTNCKAVCKKPMFVKLSPNTADISATAIAAQYAGADGISLINTLKGMAIDVYKQRPILANITGGLSGPAIMPVALSMVYSVAQVIDIPIIGMGGISSGEDAAAFMLAGASAVMVGTMNLVYPDATMRVIKGLKEYSDKMGIKNIADIIGQLKTK
ncbi:MAG: dihydroorotate dehydrogenase [Clostridia bacterium]|nr:dihydroorotate dehydrogenase [Clostridia bacterium]